MKNYAGMSDSEINRAVAMHFMPPEDDDVSLRYFWCDIDDYDYCNNWADAGPVIDEIFRTLTSTGKYDDGIGFGERDMTVWQAQIHHNKCGKLRAAMIVFLMMKDNETRILAPDAVSDE